MGKQSGKRRTSAGNTVPNGQDAGQVEAVPTVGDGNGQDGATGLEASGVVLREGKTHEAGLVAIGDLESIIKAHNAIIRGDVISRAWHPEAPAGANLQTNISDVPMLEGKAAYQLSTGEIVEL
jgi:hypothetical protein